MLRIVIVDDHPIVRKGLLELINHEPDMQVCGEGDSIETGMKWSRIKRPDVVVIDLSLGLEDGLELVKAIRASMPDVRVLVLSLHDEMLHAERSLAAGANGYVMKHEAVENLIDAIRVVAKGKTYVSPQVSERVLARLTGRRTAEDTSPLERLTDREHAVFSLIGRGLATRDIAAQLNLSVKTIETYQARIKEKLSLANVHELTRAAIAWSKE